MNNIVKTLGAFLVASLILFAMAIFLPKYHDVNRNQLQSILKSIDYKEDTKDFSDINNLLDSIPVNAALLNKDKVVTSNNDKTSQEKRISEAEKNLNNLSKNVQSGDLSLYYREDNEAFKYLGYLIPLFGGLFTGIAMFVMGKLATNDVDMKDYLKGEVARLEIAVQTYQAREMEFSRKIEKSVPDNLDEAQKLLKNLFKEKEIMLTNIDTGKTAEANLTKELEKSKEAFKDLDNKSKEIKAQLAKSTKQDKLVEELKAKVEKQSNDLKESRTRVKELESNSNENIQKELDTVQTKLSDIEVKYKSAKEEIKKLSKIDGEKLAEENQTMKDKMKGLQEKVTEYEARLKEGTVAELVKEKQEKEEFKKQLKEAQLQLEEALGSLQETDADKIKKDNIELSKKLTETKHELKESQTELHKITQSEAMKMDLIRSQLKERQKELEDVREELKLSRDTITRLKSSAENPDLVESLDNVTITNELNNRIKTLQEEHEIEKRKLNDRIIALQQVAGQKAENASNGSSSQEDEEQYTQQINSLQEEVNKLRNLASKYQNERDEKYSSFDELNSAFESTNNLLQKKEEELNSIEGKYQARIEELQSQLNKYNQVNTITP